MVDVSELVSDLERWGIRFEIAGDQLRAAPKAAISPRALRADRETQDRDHDVAAASSRSPRG